MQTLLWIALTVVGGGFIAAQSRVNGELGSRIGDPYAAALISFGLGFVLLMFAAVGSRSRGGALPSVVRAVREGRLAWWQVLGGAGGALLVFSQSLTTPLLGVALFTIAVVAGQTAGGLLVDRAGLGPAGVQSVTARRLIGALLVIAAVAVTVGGRIEGGFPYALLLFPFCSGLANAFQQAVNGRVRNATDAYTSTLLNFAVGTGVLLVAFLIHGLVGGFTAELSGTPWYLFLGGPFGIVFIGISVVAVAPLGVLRLALSLVTGQLIGSVLLDLLLPGANTVVTVWTFVGLGVALLAVAFTSLPLPRRGGDGTIARPVHGLGPHRDE
ncbi:transporter family-2 protein [Pseudoclavibacter chungangensis]|uniref:DMT family transporter n=1 Tax=Pseudoclavibacter chungangensis TaxID=587635 RepID=UPI00179603D3|nr:DMT family transporter [Pseudoclavibacter chungangensis]NYJ67999.1 transporter family-2 protein [Pseudoclavibacter chungangensis]